MENNVLELAKAIAQAYIDGYKDGLKETAPQSTATEEPVSEIPDNSKESRHYVRIHKPRKVKHTRRGIETTLVDENNRKYTFKSMRDANYFLGRGDTYISTAVARNRPIFDTQGNEYLLDEEEVG